MRQWSNTGLLTPSIADYFGNAPRNSIEAGPGTVTNNMLLKDNDFGVDEIWVAGGGFCVAGALEAGPEACAGIGDAPGARSASSPRTALNFCTKPVIILFRSPPAGSLPFKI